MANSLLQQSLLTNYRSKHKSARNCFGNGTGSFIRWSESGLHRQPSPQHQRINHKVIGLKISKTPSLFPISLECISNHFQALSAFSHLHNILFLAHKPLGKGGSGREVLGGGGQNQSTFWKLNNSIVFYKWTVVASEWIHWWWWISLNDNSSARRHTCTCWRNKPID